MRKTIFRILLAILIAYTTSALTLYALALLNYYNGSLWVNKIILVSVIVSIMFALINRHRSIFIVGVSAFGFTIFYSLASVLLF
jgi:hypothetical protein